MPSRPGWYEGYWKNLDKDTARKIRSTCPRCGSADTYYNQQFMTWRCGRCEYIFVIKGVSEKVPWWKRLFRW
ncbi:MAG: hypothetical protein IIB13_05920 [Chloroflexi bacterium]|jgi:ribosomal protein S27AE|nr:hypothetical protein [Chloroflexota bacterium]